MFNILIVEDDKELSQLFQKVLEKNGYQVKCASDGMQALETLDTAYIDLIISDIMMPVMDGYELVSRLRAAGYQIPVLMITAKGTFDDMRQGFLSGSDDYMVKPVNVNSLVSMNMWGLTPDFLDVLEEGFKEFFEKEVPGNPLKAEYLIPIFIGELLEQGKMSVKVLKTNDTWYGMTYHEDVAAVKNSFKKMLADGVYKADLFSDL